MTLHHMKSPDMKSHHFISPRNHSHYLTSHHLANNHITSCHVASMTSYHITSQHITWPPPTHHEGTTTHHQNTTTRPNGCRVPGRFFFPLKLPPPFINIRITSWMYKYIHTNTLICLRWSGHVPKWLESRKKTSDGDDVRTKINHSRRVPNQIIVSTAIGCVCVCAMTKQNTAWLQAVSCSFPFSPTNQPEAELQPIWFLCDSSGVAIRHTQQD